MKKNFKKLMALVLTGAMLTAGSAVFADYEGGSAFTDSVVGSGSSVTTNGAKKIQVVLPTTGMSFVLDPAGAMSMVEDTDIEIEKGASVYFVSEYEDPYASPLVPTKYGSTSAPVFFRNKGIMPVNIKTTVEAKPGTSTIETVEVKDFKGDKPYLAVDAGMVNKEGKVIAPAKSLKSEPAMTMDPEVTYAPAVTVRPSMTMDPGNNDLTEDLPAIAADAGEVTPYPGNGLSADVAAGVRTSIYGIIDDSRNLWEVSASGFTLTYTTDAEETEFAQTGVFYHAEADVAYDWDSKLSDNTIDPSQYQIETVYELSVPEAKVVKLADLNDKTKDVLTLPGVVKDTKGNGTTNLTVRYIDTVKNKSTSEDVDIATLAGAVTVSANNQVTFTQDAWKGLYAMAGGEGVATMMISAPGAQGIVVTLR